MKKGTFYFFGRAKPFATLPGKVECLPIVIVAASIAPAFAESPTLPASRPAPSRDVLPPRQWAHLERSIDHGLAWLATQQRADGGFPTLDTGQPAVTALCVLAFLSRGHTPGEGPYGSLIDNGIEYTLGCQHPDGLIARHYPVGRVDQHNPSHTAAYNHAITGLMLSEVFGMTRDDRNRRIRATIEAAVRYTLHRQTGLQRPPNLQGGWRYIDSQTHGHADLSITSWQLMFLRSAVNAGFEVPVQNVDDGTSYVTRCYDVGLKTFVYANHDKRHSRAMAGAGALSLSLAGRHNTDIARDAGRWILEHPYTRYGTLTSNNDEFLYSAFYCSQAMFQLGGDYWAKFYPTFVGTLLESQTPEGPWPLEAGRGSNYGQTYSTALAVLALNVPNQLLPIFQR